MGRSVWKDFSKEMTRKEKREKARYFQNFLRKQAKNIWIEFISSFPRACLYVVMEFWETLIVSNTPSSGPYLNKSFIVVSHLT